MCHDVTEACTGKLIQVCISWYKYALCKVIQLQHPLGMSHGRGGRLECKQQGKGRD